MKKGFQYIRLLLLLVVVVIAPQVAQAQSDSTSQYVLMPLVFDKQHSTVTPAVPAPEADAQGLVLDSQWLNKARNQWNRVHDTRYRLMIDNPEMVRFNKDLLPKPPKEVVVETDPSATELEVEANIIDGGMFKPIDRREVRMHNWLHSFVGSLHGSQAFISSNWYQGGENNLNLLADVQWDCNLNQKLHPNWLFNNTLHYRLGLATAKGDSLRSTALMRITSSSIHNWDTRQ